jgi:hypothetical protein
MLAAALAALTALAAAAPVLRHGRVVRCADGVTTSISVFLSWLQRLRFP